MTSRERKADHTYHSRKIRQIGPNTFTVARRKGKDGVESDPWIILFAFTLWQCNCPIYANLYKCKHIDAVHKWIDDGAPNVTYYDREDPRPTYPQDWVRYKAAKKAAAVVMRPLLLATLMHFCPAHKREGAGRKKLAVRDVLFAFALRVLNKKGGLDAQGDVVLSFEAGYFAHRLPPSEPTITRRVRAEEIVVDLESLVVETGLVARKTSKGRYSTDGAEFNTPNRDPKDPDAVSARKKARTKGAAKKSRTPKISIQEHIKQPPVFRKNRVPDSKTVKLHLLLEDETKLAAAAFVTLGKVNEGKLLPKLLDMACKHTIVCLAADKGYSSNANHQYCLDHRIRALIPPKDNYISDEDGPLVQQNAARWRAKGSTLPDEYGYRNNSEGHFSATKRVQYEDLRSKTLLAQQAEVLMMVVLRNLYRRVMLYIMEGVEIEWADTRCKKILEPVYKRVKDLPRPDLSPRYHDGIKKAS